jgi:hypothetical protein
MKLPSFADPANVMTKEEPPGEIDPSMTAHDYLKEVYQDPRLPTQVRMKAAIEALPFERPKLAVTGIIGGGDIAAMLDERLKRIAAEARTINGSPGVAAPVTNPQLAPAIPDRRYRRV